MSKEERFMKIAVIGAGISGLSCAYRLAQSNMQVSLFEANDYFGGHTHTVDVTFDGITHGVDTGFLVFNHKTYPLLTQLFDELQIPTSGTDMSFSVKLPLGRRLLEWAGTNLDSVFTQKRNLLSPRFLRMLFDIVRFNRQATAMVQASAAATDISLGSFLEQQGYSHAFRDWYLLPMAGCIWSCPTEQMLAFPLASFVQFCHNHGLLQVSDRPQWRTVNGGARQYVEKMLAAIPEKFLSTPVLSVKRVEQDGRTQIALKTHNGLQYFDHVVMAGHSDQSLALLEDSDANERSILGAVRYQPNRAILHTDVSCLPKQQKAWAAWNYQSENGREPRVCVHYLLNLLQPLPFKQPVIVSLNPITLPDPASILGDYDYAHPVFNEAAIQAQGQLAQIQGQRHTWFAGAWTGYGFHEDGLKSGLKVAQALLACTSLASTPQAA
jgi:uncharacterized protein